MLRPALTRPKVLAFHGLIARSSSGLCYPRPMIRRTLTCLLTLGLVACATQPSPPPAPPAASAPPAKPPLAPAAPASAAAEAPALPPVDLTPVPFEIARANFVRDTAAKYGIDAAQIEAVLAQAQFCLLYTSDAADE